MPKNRTHGVQVPQKPGPPRIEVLPHGLPGFVGRCSQGPMASPVRVRNWPDFIDRFGAGTGSPMNRALYAYFLNTDQPAWVTRCSATDAMTQGERLLAYQQALQALAATDVSALQLPDLDWSGDDVTILQWAGSDCERLDNRVLLVDPPPSRKLSSAARVNGLQLPTSSVVACYYPWARMQNPDFVAGAVPRLPRTILVSPSALASAVWANNDRDRGVWKAPAGLDTALTGVRRLRFAVDSATQQVLNPLGINCLRQLPGKGTLVWGARTLAGQTAADYRYIPVKRTTQYVYHCIERSTRGALFEPNDSALWQLSLIHI